MAQPGMAQLVDRSTPLRLCINGDLGGGKTTIARKLAASLDCEYYSTGRAQRSIAEQLGITTLELNKRAETDASLDLLIDAVFTNLEAEHSRIMVDSRMAWHFMRTAGRLRLICNPVTCAQRIFGDQRRQAEGYTDLDTALAAIGARRSSEQKRFLKYYRVDVEHLPNYDLVIQTDHARPDEIREEIERRLPVSRSSEPLVILSPRLVFPLDETRSPAGAARAAGDEDRPIEVLYGDDCFFVVNGHHRLSAAVRAERKWIEARLAPVADLPTGRSTEQFLAGAFALARVHAWQDAHGFEFPFQPSLAKPRND